MMERPGEIQGDNIPLSAMAKFCRFKLQELAKKSCSDTNDSQRAHLFSNILTHDSSPYKPKRREHSSGDNVISDEEEEPVKNCSDFGYREAQQLQIKRKIPLSKHIKSPRIDEFRTEDACINISEEEAGVTGYNFNADTSTTNLRVKERLEAYLPALTRHIIQDVEWRHLQRFPSLENLMLNSSGTKSSVKCGPEFTHNTYKNIYTWDADQALPVSSTPELMVFYGIISKPNSIQLNRLKKLFAYAGVAAVPLHNVSVPNKQLFLVDGTGRIELELTNKKLTYKKIVSGVAVGIVGQVCGSKLCVEDVVFPTPCTPEWPLPRENGIEMVFVSGLYLGSKETPDLALDLLQDYLLGLAGSAQEQTQVLSSRVRLFIVGNMISKSVSGKSSTLANITSNCARNIEKLDTFLEPLVRVMEVFLIPGENDLTTTSNLPQPPIHPGLLPLSGSFQTLKRMTNPAKIQVSVSLSDDGITGPLHAYSNNSILLDSSYAELLRGEVDFIDLVLQSGKNVKHTMEYCDITCPIEMAKNLIKWANLHPTCHDANTTFADNIFSLKGASPHLVVIGNLSEFRTEEFNGTKIVGVPSFIKSNTVAVLTKNFDVIPLTFKLL